MNIDSILNVGKAYFKNGLVLSLAYMVALVILRYILKKYVLKILERQIKKANKNLETSLNFAKNIFSVLLDIVIITLILMEINALASLGTIVIGAASALTVVVGLAAQESTSNFIGGFILSTIQPFKNGDLIKLVDKGIVGTVEDISLRHTVLRTINNTTIKVPNNTMNTVTIENYSEAKTYRNLFVFTIAYGQDHRKAMDIIKNLALENELTILKELCETTIVNLNDYSIDIRLSVYTNSFGEGFSLGQTLNIQVLEAFAEENIEIPFPTSTIHNIVE